MNAALRLPRWILPWILVVCCIPAAAAQGSASKPTSGPANPFQIVLGGSEDTLWLGRVTDGESILFRRQRTASFESPLNIGRPISSLCVVGPSVYATFRDGALFRYYGDPIQGSPERDIPKHRVPLSVTTDGLGPFALLPPEPGVGESEAPALPLRVARYDGREWNTIATCEVAEDALLSGRLRARLLIFDDRLFLAWYGQDGRVFTAYRGISGGNWTRGSPIQVGAIVAYWLTRVNSLPTVVVAAGSSEAGEQLAGWKLTDVAQLEWQAINWRLSTGETTRFRKIDTVAGFNQQLAVAARDGNNEPLLLFARQGEAPSESTIRINDIFESHTRATQLQDMVRFVTFLLLIGLLVGLFTFRRASMTDAVRLPAGTELALASHRILATAVDIAPFALAAAHYTETNILDSLRQLLNWGLFHGPTVPIPSPQVMLWWSLTVGGFVVYCFVLEATLGRTIGKLIAGTRVCGPGGVRAGLGAVAVRGVFRVLEMIPQFWIFAFLVVLSRNRQRLGDVFANTYVVRSARGSAPKGERDN